MSEWEWIVCKACGKKGWLDLNQPMNQTGWTHTYHLNEKNENVNYYLCDGCSCVNCPDAIVTTGYNEDGSTYPDPECQLPDGCKHLQSSEGLDEASS